VNEVEQLADLIRERNDVAKRITELIGRPAQIGHVGEWIASKVFDIELEGSAVAKGIDGRFRSGLLRGKSVNVKFYAKQEGLLAIREDALPDYFLVLVGPRSKAMTSRGDARLWYIDSVFLFHAHDLYELLQQSATVKIDRCATSVRRQLWERAEIYPTTTNAALSLDPTQRSCLGLFSSRAVAP
jgi:hypothetical protein